MKRLGWSGTVTLGMLAVAGVGLLIALLRDQGGDGAKGIPVGQRMPPFAAPLVRADLEGDVNVFTEPTDGVPAACDVRGARVLNGCALRKAGPSVLAFVGRVGSCMDELRTLERLQRAEPQLRVAAVAIKGEREKLREDLDRLRITIPVGWDRDGALSAVYRVIVCPQLSFADRGGTVRSTAFGSAPLAELRRRAARLDGG